MENTTRPYAFVGAVSGTKNSFELNDLAGDVTYTFVARGCTNGVESVDSSSISFTTPKENGTNYVQVGAVAIKRCAPERMQFFRPQYSRAIRILPYHAMAGAQPWLACVERCTHANQLDTDRA